MNRNSKNNIKHKFPVRLQLAFYLVVLLAGVSSFGGGLIQSTASIIAGSPAPVTAQKGAVVIVTDATIRSGSCSSDNGLNQNQSVTVNVCLQNVGDKDTADLQASFEPAGPFTPLVGQESYGVLKAGGPAVCRSFTATPGVPCNGKFAAAIKLQDGAINLGSTSLAFRLGGARSTSSTNSPSSPNTSFSENFDGVVVPNLPAGWETSVIAPTCPVPEAWTTGNDVFDTPPNAAQAPGPDCTADIRLDSPLIAVTTASAQLTFRNRFDFEAGFDGAVLEIRIGAGAFQDILAAGGSFVAGGYNGTINAESSNPLANRPAWTSASETFITTTVNLPAAANGQNITLRWRVGTDSSTASTGQVIDTISITDIGGACTLVCPGNITTSNTTNLCGAAVTYPPPETTGSCGTVNCSPPSGSVFQVGATTVTCTETPSNATCSFTITVNDTQPPVITCPANIIRSNDPGQCSAAVTYPSPTFTDNCPGVGTCGGPALNTNSPSGTTICTPPSGSTFLKGTTTVQCCVEDASNNSALCSFTITVNDTQAPVLTCPPNITQPAPVGQCSTTVTYSLPTVSENCPPTPTPTCNPPSGSVFPLGTTTVNCTATDSSSNTGACSFTVTVTGGQFTITCPANITANTNSVQCAATVNYPPPTVTNNCGGGVSVSCSPPAGSLFPLGVTTVTCTATNGTISSNCSFTITVSDAVPPNIGCPANIVRNLEGTQCSAIVVEFPSPVASDACSGVRVVCSPPSGARFSPGTTTVTCTATDAAGNSASCSFSVTVRDAQPPVVTCPANVVLQAPSGQCSVVVSPNLITATATDACDGPVTVVAIRSDGLALTAPFPIGTTTITNTATDRAGNVGRCVQTVTVGGASDSGRIEVMPSTLTLKTVKVVGVKKSKKRRARGTFMLTNTGCAPVALTFRPVTRVTDQNRFRETDDSEFFSVFRAGADGAPTGDDLTGARITINPGQANKQNFVVEFNPVIPSVANATSNLRTEDVLPDSFVSVLGFEGTDRTLTINASVEKKVRLIDSDDPQNGDPEVTLCRSGNEFIVRYQVFDANTADVRSVKYEFLDSSGNVVRTVDNVDLAGPIGERGLVNGQSFSVEQRFSGANDNQRVVRVRVTVVAGNTSFTATSSQINQNCSASQLRLLKKVLLTLRLPAMKLDSEEP